MDVLATILTLLGLWLNGRQHMACWPVWLASNVAWIFHWTVVAMDGSPLETSSVMLNLILVGLNVSGWLSWRNERDDSIPRV